MLHRGPGTSKAALVAIVIRGQGNSNPLLVADEPAAGGFAARTAPRVGSREERGGSISSMSSISSSVRAARAHPLAESPGQAARLLLFPFARIAAGSMISCAIREGNRRNPTSPRLSQESSDLAHLHAAYIPPFERAPGLGPGGRISYVDFFTALAKVGAKATAGPLFRANGDASGLSCPALVWGTQVSGGNTTISTSLTCMRFSANILVAGRNWGLHPRPARLIDQDLQKCQAE